MRPPATLFFGASQQQSLVRFRVQRDYRCQLKEIIFQQSQSGLGRQSMRRGKASEHSVRLNQCCQPRQSSWPAQQADSLFHLQRPHDVHAMSIRLRSYSSYPEGKPAPCLSGITRPFFAQGFSVRSTVSIERRGVSFSGNGHKQAPFPFKLHRQRRRRNGDGTFFPTNIERHSWLDPGFAANVFSKYESSGIIDGCFHGRKSTIFRTPLPSHK